MREIQKTLLQLTEYPHSGVRRDDIAAGMRVIQSGEKAMICYEANDRLRNVHIISVTYAGQDWQRIARECSGG